MNDRIRLSALVVTTCISLFPTSSRLLPALFAVEPELAAPPRLVVSHVQFELTAGGYQVILTRKASEKLRDALAAIGDGKPFTEFAKMAVKELNDPEAEKKVEMLAWIANKQAPALKKSLDELMGPGGAVIKVYGVPKKVIPDPPPLVKALGETFLPPDVKEKVQIGMKVVNTSVLYWRVEGRK
jgi:hypothetical protein